MSFSEFIKVIQRSDCSLLKSFGFSGMIVCCILPAIGWFAVFGSWYGFVLRSIGTRRACFRFSVLLEAFGGSFFAGLLSALRLRYRRLLLQIFGICAFDQGSELGLRFAAAWVFEFLVVLWYWNRLHFASFILQQQVDYPLQVPQFHLRLQFHPGVSSKHIRSWQAQSLPASLPWFTGTPSKS